MKHTTTAAAFEKELKIRAREHGTPIAGFFELTSRCNFNCKMCYVHTMDIEFAKKHELTTDQWLRIMDAAYEEGMLYATFSGGECLLRPDFKELYMHLFNKGVRISVFTNGSLLNDEYIEFFTNYRPRRLQVSLYGSNNEIYERVTYRRNFDIVYSALKKLQEKNINLEIALTPTKLLFDDFENIVCLLEQSHFNYKVNTYLLSPRTAQEQGDYGLNKSEILYVSQILSKARGKNPVPNDRIELPCPGGSCETVINGMECSAGVTRFVITWDGYMIPCIAVTEPRISVLEVGFAKSWQKLRDNDKMIVRAKGCIKCPYQSVCAKCPAVRSKDLYNGQHDEDICNLTVAMVAAGISNLPNC